MRIIPRSEWQARPARGVAYLATPTPELWIHHSASEQHGASGVRAIQIYHMDSKMWSDIAYSFLVDDDGSIFEGRGFGVVGGHTKNHNSISHAICFLGNFEEREPTAAALASARWLYHEGVRLKKWGPLTGGHRDASGALTACPGKFLYSTLHSIDLPIPAPVPPGLPKELTMQPYSLWKVAGTAAVYAVAVDTQSKRHVKNPAVLSIDQFFLTAGKYVSAISEAPVGSPLAQWLVSIPTV